MTTPPQIGGVFRCKLEGAYLDVKVLRVVACGRGYRIQFSPAHTLGDVRTTSLTCFRRLYVEAQRRE